MAAIDSYMKKNRRSNSDRDTAKAAAAIAKHVFVHHIVRTPQDQAHLQKSRSVGYRAPLPKGLTQEAAAVYLGSVPGPG